MKFIYTKEFVKNYTKITKSYSRIGSKIRLCADDFEKNLLKSIYLRKKLKSYSDVYELEVTGDYRIFVQVKVIDDISYFLNVGTHSQLGTASSKNLRINNIK